MKKMFSDYKKIVFTLTALIAVVGYGFVVFAAAPNGGYTPGSTLDPDCAPGDIDCVVALVAGGTGTPAGSNNQIQINQSGSFFADNTFQKSDTDFNVGLDTARQSAVLFTGSGLDEMNVAGSGYSGTTFPNTYTVQITQNNVQLWTIININPGVFTPGEILTGVTSGETATFVGYAGIYNDVIMVSSVSGTFSSSEDITGSTSSVTQQFNSTYSTNCDAFTLTTSTGSSLGCTNSGSFDSGMGLDGVYPQFTSFSGYTVGDSWTWTYSYANQNVLDFSNNDYKFQSTFGGDTFGYQISDDILGLGGLVGSVNTWTTTGGDFGLSGLTNLGGNFGSHTLLQWSDGVFASSELTRDRVTLGFNDTGNGFELLGGLNIFSIASFSGSGANYGIDHSNGTIRIGNLSGGNNTKITINDVTQAINFNGQYSFPFADGTANQVLTTDGAGQLSWTTVSGGSSLPTQTGHNGEYLTTDGTTASWTTIAGGGILGIGTINSQTRSANGATISGSNLILQTSNRVLPGLLIGETDSTGVTLGVGAGVGASTSNSVFIGVNAGNAASGASGVNAIGNLAGYQASAATGANFFGRYAGYQATYSSDSNFIGRGAGMFATQADHSIFIGANTGNAASAARFSVFLGEDTGRNATNAEQSIFIGYDAGFGATNASSSVFIGTLAGKNAPNAPASIFIGNQAGYNDTVDTTTGNSAILIGNATSTGGYGNSIALGTNAVNTATNQLMIGSVVRPINEVVIKGSGTCSIVSTGISCSSDERLKTNIEDLSINTLANVVNVRTVLYNWNSNPTGDKVVGFLAQDLERYFPQLVRTDSDGFKMVNYAQMTPILVEAIREMNLNITMIADMSRPNTWRDSFIAWFGNVENGITDIYANVFHANRGEFKDVQTDRICVGQTCVTETQLQQLLNQQNFTATPPTPSVTVPDEIIPDPVVTTEPPADNTDPVIVEPDNTPVVTDTNNSSQVTE